MRRFSKKDGHERRASMNEEPEDLPIEEEQKQEDDEIDKTPVIKE
jgi:hypothetical protein